MTNDVITNIEEHKRRNARLKYLRLSPLLTGPTSDPYHRRAGWYGDLSTTNRAGQVTEGRAGTGPVVLVGTATAALRIEQVRLRKARLVRAP